MWIDLTAFCVVCVLAVATVVGAAAARRTTLVTVRIAGSTLFFQDPETQQELRAQGWNVDATNLGSQQVEDQLPLKHYDAAFVASQIAAQSVTQQLGTRGIANVVQVPFQSRMVVATYRPIAELLQRVGVASRGPGGIWMFNVAAYLNVIQRGVHWRDIPGNAAGQIYPGTGRVLLSTTDPRYSNEADMLIVLASYVLDDSSAPTSQSAVKKELPLLAKCFALQGSMPTGGNPLFDSFLSSGIASEPMIFIYENEYVGQELADQQSASKRITPDMVMMYPDPDIVVRNSLITLDGPGTQVTQLFVKDPGLQSLAEQKYGYMKANPATYQQDMAAHHITVAGPLPDMGSAPTQGILQAFLGHIP